MRGDCSVAAQLAGGATQGVSCGSDILRLHVATLALTDPPSLRRDIRAFLSERARFKSRSVVRHRSPIEGSPGKVVPSEDATLLFGEWQGGVFVANVLRFAPVI